MVYAAGGCSIELMEELIAQGVDPKAISKVTHLHAISHNRINMTVMYTRKDGLHCMVYCSQSMIARNIT